MGEATATILDLRARIEDLEQLLTDQSLQIESLMAEVADNRLALDATRHILAGKPSPGTFNMEGAILALNDSCAVLRDQIRATHAAMSGPGREGH